MSAPHPDRFKIWISQAQPFLLLRQELGPLDPSDVLAIRRQLEAAFHAGEAAAASHVSAALDPSTKKDTDR